MRMYRDIPVELGRLIEPVVNAAGFEVVDVVVTRGRPPWLLRVIIDTPAGDGRVPIGDCADVSREIETHLDAADAVPSRYNLEVSSPGLGRVLAREKDFLFARGSEVRIETRRPLDGRRRFRGMLEDFDGDTAGLRVDGVRMEIPFAEVARANAVYDFSATDFVSEVRG
ncbi:MAG: ribosome maturation factor RimP [Myxococcota bacterium]